MAQWKNKLYESFELILLCVILASVVAVCLESVTQIREQYGFWLSGLEWMFTVLFTVEYLIRIYMTQRRLEYVFSFYGLVDLMSTLPSYLAIVLPGAHSFLVVRILRLLRVFRILKLGSYMDEANYLTRALWASKRKIAVFLVGVMTIILVSATLMYLVEGPENGFDSIPRAIYWAIVTITTVGYGDISPHTFLGQILASGLMLVGYTIIAVPTGIISAEMGKTQICKTCGSNLC
ncbi:MAG: ion transporter [Myxococcaceae bacterium]